MFDNRDKKLKCKYKNMDGLVLVIDDYINYCNYNRIKGVSLVH